MTHRPTRLYTSGQRFLTRRLEQGLLFGEVGMESDPVRAQSVSISIGAAAAAVAIVGCAALAWLSPQGGFGDAAIVMGRASGALYVRIGDTVHPVLNLTSARLIAGVGDDPRPVSESQLALTKRGPLLGIPGAPGLIGAPLSRPESLWTACDGAVTTVIAGPVRSGGASRAVTAEQPALVSSRSGTTYLLYEGRRAALDMAEPATVRALRLEGIQARPASPALLNLIPEAPSIVVPAIAGAGNPGRGVLAGFVVGDVVAVERAGSTEFYVVLPGGVQRIGPVTADLIRFSRARSDAAITTIAPAVLGQVPTLGLLAVSTYPERIRSPRGAEVAVLCASWAAGTVSLSAGDELPLDETSAAVPLAQADGAGPNVDAAYVPPGRTAYVRPSGPSEATGSVVTDTGVRFAVVEPDSARALRLPDTAETAPWSLVSLLPAGPALRRDAALVAHDVVGPVGS